MYYLQYIVHATIFIAFESLWRKQHIRVGLKVFSFYLLLRSSFGALT